jgi:hypothetical protein
LAFPPGLLRRKSPDQQGFDPYWQHIGILRDHPFQKLSILSELFAKSPDLSSLKASPLMSAPKRFQVIRNGEFDRLKNLGLGNAMPDEVFPALLRSLVSRMVQRTLVFCERETPWHDSHQPDWRLERGLGSRKETSRGHPKS